MYVVITTKRNLNELFKMSLFGIIYFYIQLEFLLFWNIIWFIVKQTMKLNQINDITFEFKINSIVNFSQITIAVNLCTHNFILICCIRTFMPFCKTSEIFNMKCIWQIFHLKGRLFRLLKLFCKFSTTWPLTYNGYSVLYTLRIPHSNTWSWKWSVECECWLTNISLII